MNQVRPIPALVLTTTQWAGLATLGFLVVKGASWGNEVILMGVVAGLMGLRVCAKLALMQTRAYRPQKSPPPPQLDPLS